MPTTSPPAPERSKWVQQYNINRDVLTSQDLTPPLCITPTTPESPLPASIIVSSGQTITLLDRHFQPLTSWVAWEGNGRATHIAEAGGMVLAIGEEDGSRYPVLKIWDLTREEKKRKGGGPVLLRNTKIQNGQRPSLVSYMLGQADG